MQFFCLQGAFSVRIGVRLSDGTGQHLSKNEREGDQFRRRDVSWQRLSGYGGGEAGRAPKE